jgi:hypothetical protein
MGSVVSSPVPRNQNLPFAIPAVLPAVTGLLDKIRDHKFVGETDDMAPAGILSTQLLPIYSRFSRCQTSWGARRRQTDHTQRAGTVTRAGGELLALAR